MQLAPVWLPLRRLASAATKGHTSVGESTAVAQNTCFSRCSLPWCSVGSVSPLRVPIPTPIGLLTTWRRWFVVMGYFQSIMVYFGLQRPIVFGLLGFRSKSPQASKAPESKTPRASGAKTWSSSTIPGWRQPGLYWVAVKELRIRSCHHREIHTCIYIHTHTPNNGVS